MLGKDCWSHCPAEDLGTLFLPLLFPDRILGPVTGQVLAIGNSRDPHIASRLLAPLSYSL